MLSSPPQILLIEDDPGAGSALKKVLHDVGYVASLSTTAEAALVSLREKQYDIVVTDLKLPGMDGLELITQIRTLHPRLPIILMTAHGTTESAIEAMKRGAMDYLTKPFEVEDLLRLVEEGLENASSTRAVAPEHSLQSKTGLVGQSRAMQAVYKEIGRIAALPVTVLIRGATGSGKELIAHAIHEHSDRAAYPFVAINCAAIPQALLESELFGHERGAFTGATQQHLGHFEKADGGTLFLDEIGDLPLETQAKLLRVLQDQSFHRVGGNQAIRTNVRILAATHRDLENAIREKDFREDLFYRLSASTIQVPSLSERQDDIPQLAQHFLHQFATEFGITEPRVTSEALEYLSRLPWPGNVRQLQNTIRQALLLARPLPINIHHLEQVVHRFDSHSDRAKTQSGLTAEIQAMLNRAERGEIDDVYWQMIDALETTLFPEAVKRAQGNQTKAARWLGVTRLKLREKLAGLTKPPNTSNSEQ